MLRKYLGASARVAFAALCCVGLPSTVLAQTYLGGNLTPFAVLGATPNVTCTGASTIVGDVGVSPAASITGFPTPCTDVGTLHAGDGPAAAAQANLLTAYGTLDAMSCSSTIGPDLAGLNLVPGVYCVGAAATNLSGALVLNGAGNPNATWVFEMSSSLITSPNSSVTVIGAGNACNVQWKVASSATLNDNTTFVGNILALTNITLNSGSVLTGRALARNAAVNMTGTNVSFAACGAAAVPALAPFAIVVLVALLMMGGLVTLRKTTSKEQLS